MIGNFGLSVDQQKVQMAMFAMLASPLLMSSDLRSIPAESKAILLNKGIIAINQDPLGVQAKRIIQVRNILRSFRLQYINENKYLGFYLDLQSTSIGNQSSNVCCERIFFHLFHFFNK